MRFDPARGEYLALSRDHIRRAADDDVNARLDIGITRLTDPGDASVLDADIGFDDAPVIDDDDIGDDDVGDFGIGALPLPHAVADHLAAAEGHLFAVNR